MAQQHFIDGQWQAGATGETLPVIDPSTGEVFDEIARGTAADVDRAVAAARAALNGPWGRLTATDPDGDRLTWSTSNLPRGATLSADSGRLVWTPDFGQAGTYTLRAAELLRLPAGTFAYLRDAQTGAVTNLSAQPSYSFTLQAGAPATGRFSLLISQRQVLATAPAALVQQVAVYPNPARGQVAVGLPTSLTKQPVELTLVNTLGQVVLTRTLPATHTAEVQNVSLTGVAAGVYTLRLQTEQGVVNKRFVVE